MQIVTDSGTDALLAGEKPQDIHVIPLNVTLDGITYQEGINIEKEKFYELLENSENLPITSQPSPGGFAAIYREIAKKDPDILSIHISSGLSGTINSAINAVDMVPEANITVVDTKTLSVGAGWQVAAAGKAVRAGWPKEKIVEWLGKIRDATHTVFTLKELKYLIHGGRIGHIKGLLASILDIKPIIGVNIEKGNYEQLGQARSFNKAVDTLVHLMEKHVKPGEKIAAQVVHSMNLEGADMLKEKVDSVYDCQWLPIGPMSLVLGAHTGRSMIGLCYTPAETLVLPA